MIAYSNMIYESITTRNYTWLMSQILFQKHLRGTRIITVYRYTLRIHNMNIYFIVVF